MYINSFDREVRILEDVPDPLHDISLAEFAQGFREGRYSSEGITLSYIERIELFNKTIGALTFIDGDGAINRARYLDTLIRSGVDLGPLMGVPFTVKEIIRVEGFPFGAGTKLPIGDLVPAEGPLVRQLKGGGAVVLGTTCTTEFASAFLNCLTPSSRNPWDSDIKRICGGSSTGSAAAVAAGLCAFSIGTDTGGSVRLPAALCGVVGFKPTVGTWPTAGILPVSPTFDSVGVFTRSVQDCGYVSEALSREVVLPDISLRGLVVGKITQLFEDLDPSMLDALDTALRRLADEGARIIDVEIPELSETARVLGRILPLELIEMLGRERLRSSSHLLDPVTWARVEPELDTAPSVTDAARRRHYELAESVRFRCQQFDFLVSPSTPVIANPVEEIQSLEAALQWNALAGRNTRPANLFRQCGISIPVQPPGRLPIGLQLIGNAQEHWQLLAIAKVIEGVLGRRDLAPMDTFFTQ